MATLTVERLIELKSRVGDHQINFWISANTDGSMKVVAHGGGLPERLQYHIPRNLSHVNIDSFLDRVAVDVRKHRDKRISLRSRKTKRPVEGVSYFEM